MKLIIALIILFSTSALADIELNILCWQGYAPKSKVEKFEQYIKAKYQIDIKIKVTEVSAPDEFFNGIRSKTIDLISPAHNIPKSHRWPMIQNNITLPINLKNIPNFKKISPSLKNLNYVTANNLVYGIPIVYGIYGLAYNTNIISQAPDSWDVFWQPKYKNKYSISAEYYEANIYLTALSLGYQGNQIYDYDLLKQDPLFLARLTDLATASKSFWYGVDKSEDLKGLSLATAWGFSFSKLKNLGENWNFATPKEGATGWVDHWLIGYSLKEFPLKKQLAEEWINFTLSDEMQLYYLKKLSQNPVTSSIKKKLSKEEVKRFHIDDDYYLNEQLNLWQILSRRQQNGFQQLWLTAKKISQDQ